MRSNLRFWFALSLLLVAGTILVGIKGRRGDQDQPDRQARAAAAVQSEPAGPQAPAEHLSPLLTTPSVLAAHLGQPLPAANTNRARYQLSNVPQPIDLLQKSDSAVLMRNALIDTREPIDLAIPENLRAGENPGAYIVQSLGASTAAFQDMVRASGAKIVAYIPNNAFLVTAEKSVADALQRRSGVQAVLPYEPYYKVDVRLMKFAVDNETMPEDSWLRVTLFPGAAPSAIEALAEKIGPTEKFVFGQQVLIQPHAGVLADLAQSPAVQLIEPWTARVTANDLTRVALGVSADTITNGNRYQLTGTNQWVNVNDIGVDSEHPDLKGHVFYQGLNAKADPDGHGTHVAATIAGAGVIKPVFDKLKDVPTNSARFQQVITFDEVTGDSTTNIMIDGSFTNASFRGMAPQANLFVLPVEFSPLVNKAPTDTYLIETAAATNYLLLGRDKTLISNNSWNYANSLDYDSQAARFDAAARDALPGTTGSQPVLYVFAAGNYGFSDSNDGLGGEAGRIASPGTAKNVLTIGAFESPRSIAEGLTNIFSITETNDETGEVFTNNFTNVVAIFQPITDNPGEVAPFSSRGNVGIGTEGAYGRFKPDLVAPGTFILSARSSLWKLENDIDPVTQPEVFQVINNLDKTASQYRYDSGTSFSAPSVSGVLALLQEFFTETLEKAKRKFMSPALMKAYLINGARSLSQQYDIQVQNTINYQGWGGISLDRLIPSDGTNTALMVKLDESKWPIQFIDQSPTNALATGERRTWNIEIDTNAAALPMRFTLVWTDPPANPAAGVKLVNDLDLVIEAGGFVYHGNDFLSGDNFTQPREDGILDDSNRDVVNNVENVFIGALPIGTTNLTVHVIARRVNVKSINDFYEVENANTSDPAHTHRATNEIVQDFALVMASEHTALANGPFKKIVRADAPDTFDAKKLQLDNGPRLVNALELTNQRVGANSPLYITNGVPNQWNFYIFTNTYDPNSGALMVNGTKNVAFILSTPANLGIPRNVEPDIDLYVSADKRLLDLDTNVMQDPTVVFKSTSRFGTEQLIFKDDRTIPGTTDLAPLYPEEGGVIVDPNMKDKIFYVAVKSEDQQAAEFSLIVISTDLPFEEDRGGTRILHFYPAAAIPDGLPNQPGGLRSFAVPLRTGRILDASTYLAVAHEELGDLIVNLRHDTRHSVLSNHSLNDGINFTDTNAFNFIISDYPYPKLPRPDPIEYPMGVATYPYVNSATDWIFHGSDGPGLLANYAGATMSGQWILETVDSAASHTGAVRQAEMHIKPLQKPLVPGEFYKGSVDEGGATIFSFDAPVDATDVTITISQDSNPAAHMVLLVKKDAIPYFTTNALGTFDFQLTLTNGVTNMLAINNKSEPPLAPGSYFLAITNPGPGAATFTLSIAVQYASAGANETIVDGAGAFLTDDAKTISLQDSKPDKVITDIAVAIVSENARVSDLVLHLISPQGTHVLLNENRGGFLGKGFGSTLATVNADGIPFVGPSYAVFTDHPELAKLPIKFKVPPFGDSATNRGPVAISGNSFDGATEGVYNTTDIVDGWTVDSNKVAIVASGGYTGPNYANLLHAGSISRTIPTIAGRSYRLRFAYRGQPTLGRIFKPGDNNWITNQGAGFIYSTGQIDANTNSTQRLHINAPQGTSDEHYHIINNPDPNFPPVTAAGSELFIAETNAAPFPTWFANDTNSQWVALMPNRDTGHPPGIYTNRTTFLYLGDPSALRINARMAADDGVADVLLNGVSQGIATTGTAGYSAPFVITGLTGPFLKDNFNTLDFIVLNTGGSEGFRAQLSPAYVVASPGTNLYTTLENSLGFMKLSGVESTTNDFGGAPEWRIFETEFVADKNDMRLQFFATAVASVDIDDVTLEDTGIVYLQPEEPLDILIGERSMGEWRLEAWDNRTGAVVPANLIDWQVLMTTVDSPRRAEALSNLGTYPARINNPVIKASPAIYTPGTNRLNEVEWFYFDVCPNATRLVVSLFTFAANTAPVDLLMDRSGFPTGSPNTDDYVVQTTDFGKNATYRFTLSLTNPAAAPLVPGKRIFFGVRNNNPFTTNRFAINMNSDGVCVFTPPAPLLISQRVDDVVFPSNVLGDEAARFQLQSSGAATLNVTGEEAVPLTVLASTGVEPTIDNYQVKQTITSSGDVTLPTAGNWNIKIINSSAIATPYTITATDANAVTIQNVAIANGKLTVTWTSVAGASYEIATSTDLIHWNPVSTVPSGGSTTTYTDTAAATGPAKFYRIRPLQ